MKTNKIDPASGQPYVLVAEDDHSYAAIYTLKLRREGFEVRLVKDGKTLLAEARKRVPSAVILDLIMPLKDGFWALQWLKRDVQLKKVPVLVVTNLGQDEDLTRAKELGAAEYFVKSEMSVQEMVGALRKYTDLK